MKNSTLISKAFILATGLTLLSCGKPTETNTASKSTAQGELIAYQCNDGKSFTARFSEAEAIADLPNNPNLALSRVESTSGAKYSNGITTLWDQGNEAFVESNGDMILVDCKVIQSTADSSKPPATQVPVPDSNQGSQNNSQGSTPVASDPNSGDSYSASALSTRSDQCCR